MVAPRNKTNPKTQDQAVEMCRSLQCPEKTPDRAWHRLKTVSGTEKTVCGKLQEHNIPCYYPSVRVKSNSLFEQKNAMFPGNVFCRPHGTRPAGSFQRFFHRGNWKESAGNTSGFNWLGYHFHGVCGTLELLLSISESSLMSALPQRNSRAWFLWTARTEWRVHPSDSGKEKLYGKRLLPLWFHSGQHWIHIASVVFCQNHEYQVT